MFHQKKSLRIVGRNSRRMPSDIQETFSSKSLAKFPKLSVWKMPGLRSEGTYIEQLLDEISFLRIFILQFLHRQTLGIRHLLQKVLRQQFLHEWLLLLLQAVYRYSFMLMKSGVFPPGILKIVFLQCFQLCLPVF